MSMKTSLLMQNPAKSEVGSHKKNNIITFINLYRIPDSKFKSFLLHKHRLSIEKRMFLCKRIDDMQII